MAIQKKRKKFFDVKIPLIEKETQLLAYNLEELEGRFIKYDLARMLRGKSVEAQFKVEVKNDSAIAKPIKLTLMKYFLKRAVRKGTDYIEDTFEAKCDDEELTIKSFLITRRKVSRAVRKALREKAKKEILNYIKDKKTETLFDDLIKNKFQKDLSLKLKKIYPLSLCEIRVFKINSKKE